jgi:hypothetical protein
MTNENRAFPEGCTVASFIRQLSLSFAFAAMLMLWNSPGSAATLVWNANTESDLAGYRVYQCTQQPCRRSSGTATLLATLGNVTSFNVGSPARVQYYVITAYDFANNESRESNIATYTPAGQVPEPMAPPPAPANLRLGVVW